jgi:hypothetical protein
VHGSCVLTMAGRSDTIRGGRDVLIHYPHSSKYPPALSEAQQKNARKGTGTRRTKSGKRKRPE